MTISEDRTMRGIRDGWDTSPFPLFDVKQEKRAYQYHLKHPEAFIFLIANFEGFWVIKDGRLYKLVGRFLKDANCYFYLMGEEYIRDIAEDAFRIGFPYMGCFNESEARYWSKKGRNIFIEVVN
jgi:hypothetical protein